MNKNLIILISIILFTSCSTFNRVILPLKDIPKPNGPHRVGTIAFEWEDANRKEWFTIEEDDYRRLIVQFWYPTNDREVLVKNPYLDNPKQRAKPISDQIDIPSFLMSHLDEVNKNSIDLASISSSKKDFPLIVFSHGLGGMRMQNTIQCEELASRGYIVVAMDHAFDAHATFFKNNILADFRSGIEGQISEEEFWSIRTPQLNTRAADISFVIDQISTLKESSSNSFFKAIRTDKVGIFGHSFGGATAIMASLLDSRIKACINLDGWIVPIPEKVIETGIDKPFLYIGQEAWNDTLNYIKLEKFIKNSNSSNRVLKLKGTKHYDFTDIPQIAPIASKIGITGSMNTLELKHLINKEVVDFFDSLIY